MWRGIELKAKGVLIGTCGFCRMKEMDEIQ
jgi:hypothetical protein